MLNSEKGRDYFLGEKMLKSAPKKFSHLNIFIATNFKSTSYHCFTLLDHCLIRAKIPESA